MKKRIVVFTVLFVLSTVYSRAFLLCQHLILLKAKGVFSKAVAKKVKISRASP